MNNINTFEKMLDLLQDGRRWIKGQTYSATGMCLMGAYMSIHQGYNSCEGFEILKAIIGEQYPDRTLKPTCASVASFNDHKDTVWEDVERVLEKAVVQWEEKFKGE